MLGQMAQQLATHTACTRCSLYMRMSLHLCTCRPVTLLRTRRSVEASGEHSYLYNAWLVADHYAYTVVSLRSLAWKHCL